MNKEIKKIEEMINKTDDKNLSNVDWNKTWSKKYPILKTYKEEVNINKYSKIIRELLDDIEETYKYSKEDSMLVLKDILAQVYFNKK